MTEISKKWWESKTIRGIVISAVCKGYLVVGLFLRLAGIQIPILPAGFDGVLDTGIALVGAFVGDVVAVIGRIKATKTIEQ